MIKHGGTRANSGRKHPASPYGEKTSVMRVPDSIKPAILVYLNDYKKLLSTPLLSIPDVLEALPVELHSELTHLAI